MIERTILLGDMHCTNCAFRIDGVLEDIDGVKEARTSYARSRTRVTFDPEKVTLERLLAAVRDAGYQAREAP